jgi:hypothetical protein
LGCSRFARHYSGNRVFFLFLWVLRCISSPACLLVPYVFRHGYVRTTARGFPHSEIPGSKVVQHLTGAYRSRPRPSSAPGAKASTTSPYYLDRKEHHCRYAVLKVRAGVPAPSPLTHHAPATEVDRRVSVGESSPRGRGSDLPAARICGLSKLNSMETTAVDIVIQRLPRRTERPKPHRTDCVDSSHGGNRRRDP